MDKPVRGRRFPHAHILGQRLIAGQSAGNHRRWIRAQRHRSCERAPAAASPGTTDAPIGLPIDQDRALANAVGTVLGPDPKDLARATSFNLVRKMNLTRTLRGGSGKAGAASLVLANDPDSLY